MEKVKEAQGKVQSLSEDWEKGKIQEMMGVKEKPKAKPKAKAAPKKTTKKAAKKPPQRKVEGRTKKTTK